MDEAAKLKVPEALKIYDNASEDVQAIGRHQRKSAKEERAAYEKRLSLCKLSDQDLAERWHGLESQRAWTYCAARQPGKASNGLFFEVAVYDPSEDARYTLIMTWQEERWRDVFGVFPSDMTDWVYAWRPWAAAPPLITEIVED